MPYLEGEQMLDPLMRDLQSITQEDAAPFEESFQLRRRKKSSKDLHLTMVYQFNYTQYLVIT